MADSKITALASIGTGTDPANDPLVIVDVSDVSPGGMSATGTTKKVTLNNLLACSPTATLASATITGDLTVDTSTLKVDSANNRVGIGTASPATILDIQSAGGVFARIQNTASSADAYLLVKNTVGEGFFGINATGPYIYTAGSLPITFTTATSERYRIASDGVATWSNVGGVAGTAMTLNSTGLGIGASPSDKLTVSGGASFTAFAINANPINFTGTSQSFARFRNAGGDFYYGVEGSVGGTFFTGSTAYAACFLTGNTPIQFITNGALRATIDTSGNVGIGVTPSAGKGCLQLSSGITFPATQVASSDPNTLDDYEEGTFTATLKGTVSDPTTPVTTTARYTKIGRVVTVTIQFSSVTTTGASGRIQIDGLPFTNNSSLVGTGSVGFNGMATFTGSPFASLSASSSTIAMFASNSSGAYTAVTFNAGTTQDLWTSLTYTV